MIKNIERCYDSKNLNRHLPRVFESLTALEKNTQSSRREIDSTFSREGSSAPIFQQRVNSERAACRPRNTKKPSNITKRTHTHKKKNHVTTEGKKKENKFIPFSRHATLFSILKKREKKRSFRLSDYVFHLRPIGVVFSVELFCFLFVSFFIFEYTILYFHNISRFSFKINIFISYIIFFF